MTQHSINVEEERVMNIDVVTSNIVKRSVFDMRPCDAHGARADSGGRWWYGLRDITGERMFW